MCVTRWISLDSCHVLNLPVTRDPLLVPSNPLSRFVVWSIFFSEKRNPKTIHSVSWNINLKMANACHHVIFLLLHIHQAFRLSSSLVTLIFQFTAVCATWKYKCYINLHQVLNPKKFAVEVILKKMINGIRWTQDKWKVQSVSKLSCLQKDQFLFREQ